MNQSQASYRFDFFEYGKGFLPARATDYMVLAFSDPALGDRAFGAKYERDLLAFRSEAPFAKKPGSITVALLQVPANLPGAGSFVLAQVQRRQELDLLSERERKASRFPDRPFNQSRFIRIERAQLEQLLRNGWSFLLELLHHRPLAGNGAGGEAYLLEDYRFETFEDAKTQVARTGPLLISPNRLVSELHTQEALYAATIARELLKRYEQVRPESPALFVLAPKLSSGDQNDSIRRKAAVLELVQYWVYPRLGPITFAFDSITNRRVQVTFLHNQQELRSIDGANVLTLDDSRDGFATNSSMAINRLVSLSRDERQDPVLMRLLAHTDMALEDAFNTLDILGQGYTYPERIEAIAQVLRYLTLPGEEDSVSLEMRRLALSALAPTEVRQILSRSDIDKSIQMEFLQRMGVECQWQLDCFAPYFLSLHLERQKLASSRKLLAHSVSSSSRASIAQIRPESLRQQLCMILLELRPYEESQKDPVRFSALSGQSESVVQALLLSEDPLARKAIGGYLAKHPRDTILVDELLTLIRNMREPELLDWALSEAEIVKQMQSVGIVDLLSDWLSHGTWNAGNVGQVLQVVSAYNKAHSVDSSHGLLVQLRGQPGFSDLWKTLMAYAVENPKFAEELFFKEIAYLDFGEFSQAYGYLCERLSSASVQRQCTEGFQYLVLTPSKRPSMITLKGATQSHELEEKVFNYRIRHLEALSVQDLEEQVAQLNSPGSKAGNRLRRLLEQTESARIVQQLDPSTALVWLRNVSSSLAKSSATRVNVLIEVFAGLNQPNDEFVYYYIEELLGYRNIGYVLSYGTELSRASAQHKLSDKASRYLRAIGKLDQLTTHPTSLNRESIDLIAENISWHEVKNPSNLVEELVRLSDADPDASFLGQALGKFLAEPKLFREYLASRVGYQNASDLFTICAWWRNHILKRYPGAHPQNRRYLVVAQQLRDLDGIELRFVSEGLIDLLAENVTWTKSISDETKIIGQLISIAQSGQSVPIAETSGRLLALVLKEPWLLASRLPEEHLVYLLELAEPGSPAHKKIQEQMQSSAKESDSSGELYSTARSGEPSEPRNASVPRFSGESVDPYMLVVLLVLLAVLITIVLLLRDQLSTLIF